MGCNVTCIERIRNAFKILVQKPEEKGPLGKHRCTWKDAIKMWLKGIQFVDVK
jgi:hypothetical protein